MRENRVCRAGHAAPPRASLEGYRGTWTGRMVVTQRSPVVAAAKDPPSRTYRDAFVNFCRLDTRRSFVVRTQTAALRDGVTDADGIDKCSDSHEPSSDHLYDRRWRPGVAGATFPVYGGTLWRGSRADQ